MNRRQMTQLLGLGVMGAAGTVLAGGESPQAQGALTDEDMRVRTVPAWFQDAKLGIFIHWGIYAVPGWAPPVARGLRGHFADLEAAKHDVRENPYAEWYWNGLRLDGSATQKYHVARYGRDFKYYDFQPMFETANTAWQAGDWAKLFTEAGARYAVLTSKHHEGYRMWPSAVPNTKLRGHDPTSGRDLVGEFVTAMRSAGLRAGLYYSGGFDWTFSEVPVDFDDPQLRSLRAEIAAAKKAGMQPPPLVIPSTQEYADYVDRHLVELIDRYRPDVLWNDIGYPRASRIREILYHYTKTVPTGVINDRFSLRFADFKTPEYQVMGDIQQSKWESTRGVGTSFGFNRNEGEAELLAAFDLIQMFVDIVSKNGNLLLDVGPRADGSIPGNQQSRLRSLGAWLRRCGTGIYGSTPWKRAADVSEEGLDVRYTQSSDAVYVFLLDRRGEKRLTLPNFPLSSDGKVIDLGTRSSLAWRHTSGLEISLPDDDGSLVPGFQVVGAELASRRVAG